MAPIINTTVNAEPNSYHHSADTLFLTADRTISVNQCSAMDDHFDQIPSEFDFSLLGMTAASRRGSLPQGYSKAWRDRLRIAEAELEKTMAEAEAAGLDPRATI